MGMAVLHVCRQLMLHQPTAVILKALGDMLHLIWSSYNDIDVRDLARFYYMLLTNISGDELRHTLVNKSGTLASINDIMTDNLKLAAACQAADPVTTVAPGSIFSGMLRVQRESAAMVSPTFQEQRSFYDRMQLLFMFCVRFVYVLLTLFLEHGAGLNGLNPTVHVWQIKLYTESNSACMANLMKGTCRISLKHMCALHGGCHRIFYVIWVGDFAQSILRKGDFHYSMCTFSNVRHPYGLRV